MLFWQLTGCILFFKEPQETLRETKTKMIILIKKTLVTGGPDHLIYNIVETVSTWFLNLWNLRTSGPWTSESLLGSKKLVALPMLPTRPEHPTLKWSRMGEQYMKAFLESRVDPVQICLGDSAFQSTLCLFTQYRQQEVGRYRKKGQF